MENCATSTPITAKSGGGFDFAVSSTSHFASAAPAPAIDDNSFENGTFERFHVKCRRHLNGENSGGLFFCELLKRATGRVRFDVRLIALLIAFALVIIVLKIIIVTMPFVNKDSVLEISSYAQSKLISFFKNVQEVRLRRPLFALVGGIALTLFSCMLIHMDSSRPGLNPPSPFSPKTKERIDSFRRKQAASVQLSYMTAFLVGLCVTGFIFFDVYN